MKRVGFIIPAVNRIVEDEMLSYLPPGVRGHVTRLRMTGPQEKPLDALAPAVTEASAALVDAGCEVVVFHCTANSTADGLVGEQRLLAAVREGGAPHATSTATALRHALEALRVRSLALVTPYSQATTDHETLFLREIGQEVVYAKGWALDRLRYADAPSSLWVEKGAEAAEGADVVFLSCANISAISAIAPLEARIGKPVLTSNQIALWDALRALGDRSDGPGALYRAA